MSEFEYTIILHPDTEQGGYWVTVPALPGCVSQGDTLGQAIENAKEAILLYVETLISDGQPVPCEEEHPQAVIVKVAAQAA